MKNILAWAGAIAIFACAVPMDAQQAAPQPPYASIGSKGVSYAGPGRAASYNLRGATIHIGILAPMHGPEKADGEAIVRAARMALKDEAAQPLPAGFRLALVIGDESGPAWGHATSAVLQLVFGDHAVAIVTSANGATAHLSEQVGNKIGVPILTLSGDDTTTQINLPWIFRVGPGDVPQARIIAQDIYRERGFRRVLLVAGYDHDGRIGGREFKEAVRQLGGPAPATLTIDPLQPDANSLVNMIREKSPQAIVFWTRPENANRLIQAIRAEGIHAPIYLSQETAQTSSGLVLRQRDTAGVKDPADAGIYTVASIADESASDADFARRYYRAAGTFPSAPAAETYDAVRLVARAVREAGPNRARVRDRLSATQHFAGASGMISFDNQGNNPAKVRLIRLQ